ncbi:hypothetical protein ABZ471_22155 [Streptomyces sp. NPDC005728]|uniref:hypothetical protein n=1 Tax=Streptomyces sp. NPDC005728 TaxID=3157054 RepID=UPI00340B8264
MSGGEDGKDIRAAGLDEIAKGITQTLAELKELGVDSLAGVGRGFTNLELSGLQLGHEALTSKFESFCERWEWGVRALVAEGNTFAEGVGLSAGTLYETDQYVGGALKVGYNSVAGNPFASEDDVTKKSWDELNRANADALAHPDYSGKSFSDAWEESKQGFKDAGRDAMTGSLGLPPGVTVDNLNRVTGNSDDYNRMLDDMWGPSPEERAKVAEQRQKQQDGSAG